MPDSRYKVYNPQKGWEREFTDRYGNLIYNDYIAQFRGLNREQIKSIVRQGAAARKAEKLLSREEFEGELEKQARRMLRDPRAWDALAKRCGSQWLRLQDLEKLSPDALTYPYFDKTLSESMMRETE